MVGAGNSMPVYPAMARRIAVWWSTLVLTVSGFGVGAVIATHLSSGVTVVGDSRRVAGVVGYGPCRAARRGHSTVRLCA